MTLAHELAFSSEYLALRRSKMWRGAGVPEGAGRGVVLVAGFGNPPSVMGPLARWLARGGWDPILAQVGYNVDCGERVASHVDDAVSTARDRTGRPVALIGHSRGGLIGRVVAVRRPAAIDTLVTLATPWIVGMPDTPRARKVGEAISWANERGASFLRSFRCADGTCCAALRSDANQTPRAEWTAVWSSRDALAGRMSVPPPEVAHQIDIRTTHQGAMLSIPAWRAIAAALDR